MSCGQSDTVEDLIYILAVIRMFAEWKVCDLPRFSPCEEGADGRACRDGAKWCPYDHRWFHPGDLGDLLLDTCWEPA